MWASLVVVLPPDFDLEPCIVEGAEVILVQAFVAQSSVERLDEGVLGRLSRLDKVELYTSFVCPLVEILSGKFGTIIDSNHLGKSSPFG